MNEKTTPTTTELLQQAAPSWAPNATAKQVLFMPAHRGDPLRPEKVAILGTAPSSRSLAPFHDPTWTIWGSSPGNAGTLPRTDAWFEIHSNLDWPENASYGLPYLKWLNEQTFPVVAQTRSLISRGSVQYPFDDMIARFGPYFFTSTFAWMLAFAIDRGAKEIGLYGVDMASKDEYILQRPGGHHFIQLARERGIKVHIPPESDLAQHPPFYGFSESTAFGRKLASREVEIKGRVSQAEQQMGALQAQVHYLRGALEDLDYCKSIWGGVAKFESEPPAAAIEDQIARMNQQAMQQAAYKTFGSLGDGALPGKVATE